MPNWFYFSLNVSGEKKDVEQFVENVKGSEKFARELVQRQPIYRQREGVGITRST
jgi:hypothetical protein